MKKIISLFMIAFMTICIFKTNSVEANSSIYFKIMNVDIQSGKCIVEGYFHNIGSKTGKITGVRFYGPLIEENRFDSKNKKIYNIDVTFPDYNLILKPAHKAYETFVVLDDHFSRNLTEDDTPLYILTPHKRWDVECEVYSYDD